ncbi:cell wall-associated NlpC family hydrolase [Clostridiales Family XIII bacterium PM5-7]
MTYYTTCETIEKHEKEDSIMTENFMTLISTKIKRVFKTTASVLLIAIMTFVFVFGGSAKAFAGTEGQNDELWAITIRDEVILYVNSQEAGNQVIEGLKESYLTEGSDVIDVNFDPEIQVNRVYPNLSDRVSSYSSRATDVEAAIEILREGKTEYYVYETEEGDTLNSIAKAKGISAKRLVTLNFEDYERDETIKEGSYLVLYREADYVKVTTVERVTSEESIAYKTIYKSTKSLKKGTMKVQTKGVKGSKEVVEMVTKVNGEATESKLISSEVIKKAKNKVVLKGTTSVTAKAGVTYDFVEGSEIVEYAKKFVGNPYRYGGTSLTNGADCSGFVYSVYKHFGINLPRVGQSSMGKAVSYKNVKKGDILVYSGHVAIYAGNGKAVHAVNERLGIRVTSVGYTGSVIAVRRIVD